MWYLLNDNPKSYQSESGTIWHWKCLKVNAEKKNDDFIRSENLIIQIQFNSDNEQLSINIACAQFISGKLESIFLPKVTAKKSTKSTAREKQLISFIA